TGEPIGHGSDPVQSRRVFSFIESQGAIMIDKGIKTFIHPCIATFVGSDDHWEPVVSEFVISYSPQGRAGAFPATKVKTRIFHSSDMRGDVHCSSIWIFEPFFGIILH